MVAVPMVTVPDRAGPVFAWTEKPNEPFPVPLPDAEIKEALLVTFHWHPAELETLADPAPPGAGNETDPGLTL